jgi:hypothetical protein
MAGAVLYVGVFGILDYRRLAQGLVVTVVRVLEYALDGLLCEVQARETASTWRAIDVLEPSANVSPVFIVVESPQMRIYLVQNAIERVLTCVAKRCVTQVVGKGAGLRQVAVQTEASGYCRGELHDLDTMAQTAPQVIVTRDRE